MFTKRFFFLNNPSLAFTSKCVNHFHLTMRNISYPSEVLSYIDALEALNNIKKVLPFIYVVEALIDTCSDRSIESSFRKAVIVPRTL